MLLERTSFAGGTGGGFCLRVLMNLSVLVTGLLLSGETDAG